MKIVKEPIEFNNVWNEMFCKNDTSICIIYDEYDCEQTELLESLGNVLSKNYEHVYAVSGSIISEDDFDGIDPSIVDSGKLIVYIISGMCSTFEIYDPEDVDSCDIVDYIDESLDEM